MVYIVFADISLVNNPKDEYLLGERVAATFKVTGDELDGLFKLTLVCDDANLDYFIDLVTLGASQVKEIVAPELRLQESMKGACFLKAVVSTLDKRLVDSFDSSSFEVKNKFDITLTTDKAEYDPEDEVMLTGNLELHYDDIQSIAVNVDFDDKTQKLNITQKTFEVSLGEFENSSSGKHALFVIAEDSFGNRGEELIYINVAAIPTRISAETDAGKYDPLETVDLIASIYDQTDILIEGKDIKVTILDDDNDPIFDATLLSGGNLKYQIPRFSSHGVYKIELEYDELSTEINFEVGIVDDVEVTLGDQVAVVTNIGNVVYDRRLNVNLVGDKTYAIDKHIKLKPGEEITIDLSKEVPAGDYEVSVPIEKNVEDSAEEAVAEQITGQVVAETESSAEDVIVQNISTNMSIDDRRSIFKKAIHGVGSVTGYFIGSDGILSRRPGFSLFLFVLVGILIVIILKRDELKHYFGKVKPVKKPSGPFEGVEADEMSDHSDEHVSKFLDEEIAESKGKGEM